MDRRQFLTLSAMAAVGMAVPSRWLATPSPVQAFSNSWSLKKFVQPLRGVGGSGIPVATKDATQPSWTQRGATHYTIDIGQYEDQLHPDLPNPTRLWGYSQGGNARHLGGIIATMRGAPVQITFRNNLPNQHILPVDATIMGTDLAHVNRANTHLHGGLVPWVSDGGPHAWWDPNGEHGVSFLNNSVLRKDGGAQPNEAEYYYPNDQGSRFAWYHDHTFGTTRLNAYAGIASGYVIYDNYEVSLMTNNNLPGPLDPRTVYMVFQDKIFVRDEQSMATADPNWFTLMPNSRPGDLWYAHEYETARWDLGPTPAGAPGQPSVIPEFFGDTMLVNGTVAPYLELEPRQYRFRLLNACQARFLNPRLVYADASNPSEPNPNAVGPAFIQIGTEGGFLPYPTIVNAPKLPRLLLAPAERADLIVDLRSMAPGTTLILYNDAPAPYPMGDPVNDYYPGNPDTPSSIPGYAPNTRTLLQIRIKARSGPANKSISLPPFLNPTDRLLIPRIPGLPVPNLKGAHIRRVTLNEDFDELGRLIQMEGTDQPTGTDPVTGMPMFGRGYMDGATEVVSRGSVEIWEIINLTGDTHPIHFHLVNVQLLARQPFDAANYTGGAPRYTGSPIGPDMNELGWKETVRVNPGEVARVLMKFDLPSVPFKVPQSPRTGGHEYVWHCHILEHEEHDMMRPLIVK